MQQEAAAAAQNSSIENSTNLAANNQQSAQQPPNNVSSQPGPGAQSLPQNNQQQSMRPISSPNSSSSGSRSMSPAVGKLLSTLILHIHEIFSQKNNKKNVLMARWYGFVELHGMRVGKDKRLLFPFFLKPRLPRLRLFPSFFSFIV